MIPLLDIQAQHASIQAELDEAMAAVMRHGRFVGGPELAEFEQAFAGYCDASECVGCSSGTSAIALALRAGGIGPGDEVITSAFTFIATVEPIVEVGAEPVLTDVDPDTGLMRVEDCEAALTPRSAAILLVHLYGQPVDMTAFRELADRHGLKLIEDAAQAHGADWDGGRVGSLGDAAAFSFFPGKNLGALGDGGALTTSDPELARRARSLRDHGRVDKYRHDELGTNARLDTLQAAVLMTKLRHLDDWNEARRRHAHAYDAAFETLEGVEPMRVDAAARSVYHQYVVRVADRDAAVEALRRNGIAAGVHYPIPLHRQPALADRHGELNLPGAETLADEVLSLPVYPELSDGQRDEVVAALSAHALDTEARLARSA
ncbi:MAG TPA: DegT/DnrJ/EryC1/StrS family aminotransferase [Acidimicrobiia bacterium]